MEKIFKLIFWLSSFACILGRFLDWPWLDYVFKPCIMIGLGLSIWLRIAPYWVGSRIVQLLPFAVLFAWLGDVLLMFSRDSITWADPMLFFMLGLSGFMVMQLIYLRIYTLVPPPANQDSLLQRQPLIALPVLFIIIGFVALIYPNPKVDAGMLAALVIYGSTLGLMALLALNRYGRVSRESFRYVFGGAVLFLISDLIIGLDKFVFPHYPNLAGAVIMLSYVLAQYFILEGLSFQVLGEEHRRLMGLQRLQSYYRNEKD